MGPHQSHDNCMFKLKVAGYWPVLFMPLNPIPSSKVLHCYSHWLQKAKTQDPMRSGVDPHMCKMGPACTDSSACVRLLPEVVAGTSVRLVQDAAQPLTSGVYSLHSTH